MNYTERGRKGIVPPSHVRFPSSSADEKWLHRNCWRHRMGNNYCDAAHPGLSCDLEVNPINKVSIVFYQLTLNTCEPRLVRSTASLKESSPGRPGAAYFALSRPPFARSSLFAVWQGRWITPNSKKERKILAGSQRRFSENTAVDRTHPRLSFSNSGNKLRECS